MSAPTDSLVSLAAFVDGLSAFVGYTPPSPPPSPVTFVASNAMVQGSWLGVYGGDGYVLPGIGGSLPSYATVTPAAKSDYVWAASASDTRAVQSPDGATRKAACWYSPTSFDVSVDVGPNPVRVALYFVDWDATNRSQRVDVLDASGTILDTRTVSGFHGGIWLVYTVTGAVRFKFTRLAGQNAVLSAICFGGNGTPPLPPPPPPPPPPPVGGLNIAFNFTGGITPSQQAIFIQAGYRWQRIIQEPTRTVTITAQGFTIDGQGGILGSGGPGGLGGTPSLPVTGSMVFDSADLNWAESNGYLLDIITHEMGHVLGIGTISQWGLALTGFGTDPQFTGKSAVAAYNARFGKSGTSVPVENTGGNGTANVHWREGVFGNELMTGFYNAGRANPISAVTVGALADLGWNVNPAGAEAYLEIGTDVASVRDGYRLTTGLTVVGHDPNGTPRHGKRCKVTR